MTSLNLDASPKVTVDCEWGGMMEAAQLTTAFYQSEQQAWLVNIFWVCWDNQRWVPNCLAVVSDRGNYSGRLAGLAFHFVLLAVGKACV